MASASRVEFYRTGEVSQILGISLRQLRYWAQTDLVRPSLQSPGGHHRYAFRDLIALKAAKQLIDAGVSVSSACARASARCGASCPS